MNTFAKLGFAASQFALLACAGTVAQAQERIVSIGGAVTEIVYALGQQDRLVARDSTSGYPVAVEDLPDIGYIRQLSPESVLAVSPDLILTEEGAGPPEAVELIESAGVPFVEIPEGYDAEAILAKIAAVGAALGMEEAAEQLSADVAAQLEAAMTAAPDNDASVMFILSTRGGRIMASGAGTAADAIIAMAGARNAVEGVEGYKTLTDEAIAVAAPDIILMMTGGGTDHDTGLADLAAIPALAATPAVQNGALVKMDGMYMLGFSVRTADAVRDLSDALAQAGG